MENIQTKAETRRFGAPEGWDPQTRCQTISVWDTPIDLDNGTHIQTMVTFWKPTEEELKALVEGGAIRLGISGSVHPVIFIDTVEKRVMDVIV